MGHVYVGDPTPGSREKTLEVVVVAEETVVALELMVVVAEKDRGSS